MTTSVLRALTIAVAVVVAFAIGHSAKPAEAMLAVPAECRVDPAPTTPADPIPLSRGHLVVV